MKRLLYGTVAVGLLVAAGGCGTKNPVGGSNSLTVPKGAVPAMGASVKYVDQPITLTVQNAVTTGGGALTYTFEVASDEAFNTKVAVKDNVTGGTTQTSVKLDAPLAGGKGYFWRARANDGSSTGPYSSAINFSVGSAIDLQAPQPESPAIGATIGGTRPTFTINNAGRSGPVGAIYYRFEVADNTGFNPLTSSATVPEQSGGMTSWTPDADLPTGKTLYWHVRTTDPANNVSSSFSNTRSFSLTVGIDLNTVVYVKGPNVANWKQTSTMTSVVQGEGWLCTYHTMLGQWPATQYFDTDATVEGNQWVIAYINGKWYAGAADWYRPGQACKAQDAGSIGGDNFYNANEEPLHSWVPRPGEGVGYMVTTPARMWPQMATRDERTQTVIEPWK